MTHLSPSARRGLGLLGFLLITFSAPALGSSWPPDGWFAALAKPDWNPPSWLFGPVWMLLYTLMAVAAWLVWKQGGFSRQRRPLSLYFIQLALNAAWTPLFFGAHQLLGALIVIGVLWIAILLTCLSFRPVSRTAALLLFPYLGWVTFATALNFTIWRLNP